MKNRSRTTIFLMEQLIAVAVFAVCAAVCVSIFVESYLTAEAAEDLNRAMVIAKNGAERLKAGESLEAPVFYDEDWQPCAQEAAAYMLLLENGAGGTGGLAVERITGELIIGFPVAKGGRP
jgi:hypothetical protein